MRFYPFGLLLVLASANSLQAKVVVFSEPGFPTVGSQPISNATLTPALGGDTVFAGVNQLTRPETLRGANLLVLPYGSAFPVEAWGAIERYLHEGGNLLVLGGQPFRVPVTGVSGTFTQLAAQDTWARELDLRHTYAVPGMESRDTFAWRKGYEFLPKVSIRAREFFAVEGELDGLGYMVDASRDKVAAPVIVADHERGGSTGSRMVALDFDPEPGYWESADGIALIGAAAAYAEAGATRFWIEEEDCVLRPGELPLLTLHLRRPDGQGNGGAAEAEAHVEMLSGGQVTDSANVPLNGAEADAAIPFRKALPAGFYNVRATLSFGGQPREFYANGFFVEERATLDAGPALGVDGNFLARGGKPFFPVGTNYFSTESNGWDFSGPRNAQVWEDDFADMERHGVNFVRTGVWMSNAKFVEPVTGGANERFLRNVEAFLAAAQRHHIVVNFNFFAFSPQAGGKFYRSESNKPEAPPPNPYLNPEMVRAEQAYVLSVVRRFAHVPFLCWDLINEPSFSNPRAVFHGNVPNGDPSEISAWHEWLRKKYPNLHALAAAWRIPPDHLGNFDDIPLPDERDLDYERSGNAHEERALDYNLFAQDMFSQWVHGMVEAIRGVGSTQLIDVGQDEGGVTDRVLNQFYATSGVSFTTNHTYWQDDALLWDSVAAKYPGIPNITGETGYQPVLAPDGTPRYDELTGTALEERKWALGFAAGSSGALQWDWDREGDFGIERSDGSAKVWEDMMRDLGRFGEQAAPWATGVTLPQIAIVLPQSLQLSVYNSEALEAQQTAVRALYNYDHAPAYAVGEYQIGTLGAPKLIILASAYGLTDNAWKALLEQVRAGAVLLISGPFAGDAHLHPTDRDDDVGLGYVTVPLELREQTFTWAGVPLQLTYGGMKTTTLSRAELPGGKDWVEQPLGKGRILFSALPLELNEQLDSVAQVYAYAMKAAGIEPVYTTTVTNPGILICPTVLPHATLYVLTSETNETAVSFRDQRSGKSFTGTLEPGHAALLLIGEDGTLLTNYRWHGE
ncbi:MAG TPA: alpha-amylase family protein [Acidobacteriaceae bacterium]